MGIMCNVSDVTVIFVLYWPGSFSTLPAEPRISQPLVQIQAFKNQKSVDFINSNTTMHSLYKAVRGTYFALLVIECL